MANPFDDAYWQSEFDITQDDLDRIAGRMRKDKQCFTLTDMSKRIIRGRLEHGEDTSPAALPTKLEPGKVRLWDPAKEWKIGDRAILVTKHGDNPIPTGEVREIIAADEKHIDGVVRFKVDSVDDRLIELERAAPDSEDAEKWSRFVEDEVRDREREIQSQNLEGTIDIQTDLRVLKDGDYIAGRLLETLQKNVSFVAFEDRWCLEELLTPLNRSHLRRLNRMMQSEDKSWQVVELLALLEPPWGTDDLSLFSLHLALCRDDQELFENTGSPTYPNWRALPPPWDKAVVTLYAYDPDSYQILVEPSQRLNQKLAQRLEELGLYRVVVEAYYEDEA